VDLHDSSKKKEKNPDGSKDDNVFDIQQGVAISILTTLQKNTAPVKVFYIDLWGTRETKYAKLLDSTTSNKTTALEPQPEFFFFVPKNFSVESEYSDQWSLNEIFLNQQNAVKTDRDELFIDFDKSSLEKRIKIFYSQDGLSQTFRQNYRIENSSSYDLISRRNATSFRSNNIHQCLYRPFDERWIYYALGLTSRPAWDVTHHAIAGENLSLLSTRQITSLDFGHILCTRLIAEIKVCSHDRATNYSPLYLHNTAKANLLSTQRNSANRRANLAPQFIADFAARLGLKFSEDTNNPPATAGGSDSGRGDLSETFAPEDVFHYIYAVFHSPAYRTRYAEFLKIDFPRVPITSDRVLFRNLCQLGANLVALHLLEDDYQAASWNRSVPPAVAGGSDAASNPPAIAGGTDKNPLASNVVRFHDAGSLQVAKGFPKYTDGKVHINPASYFAGVTEAVWNFHVGGYQVAHKWLKDRRERTLSPDDINHYTRTCHALASTIEHMRLIDETIQAHGGFPLVGSLDATPKEATNALPFA